MFIFLCACLLTHMCVLRQDMGQDVEPYFQEVLATLEQSAEEGSRGEGRALRGRLQQLYSEIVADTDSGKPLWKGNTAKGHASFKHSCSVLDINEVSGLAKHQCRKENHRNHSNIWLFNRLALNGKNSKTQDNDATLSGKKTWNSKLGGLSHKNDYTWFTCRSQIVAASWLSFAKMDKLVSPTGLSLTHAWVVGVAAVVLISEWMGEALSHDCLYIFLSSCSFQMSWFPVSRCSGVQLTVQAHIVCDGHVCSVHKGLKHRLRL